MKFGLGKKVRGEIKMDNILKCKHLKGCQYGK